MKSLIKVYIILILCALNMSETMWAQGHLNSSLNMPRFGDSFHRRLVDNIDIGQVGENQVWDFRDLHLTDEVVETVYYCDSDSVMLYALEDNILLKYLPTGDTLSLTGYETNLKAISYTPSLLSLSFPCYYGDHHIQPYQGCGTYCGKYVIESNGTFETEADATGVICLNDEDTLYNVIRLHQIYTAGIWQHLPEDTVPASENIKQRIEERYLWYARGYRYPVLETVSVTIYNDLIPVTCQQQSFCTLPADQSLPEDSANQQVLMQDSLERIHDQLPPIIHYAISVEPVAVHVHYSLDADANINAIVCDRLGVVYRRASASGNAGESGILHINTGGLRTGIYILYLNVNGQIFNEKIEL